MNGSTAKIINAAAKKYRVKSRRLKRAYNKLNHIERGEVKHDMYSFCMELRQRDKVISGLGNKGALEDKKAKKRSDKVRSDKVGRNQQSTIENHKSSILRKAIAWVMLKLGFWNYETSYRFERNLPTKESTIINHKSTIP